MPCQMSLRLPRLSALVLTVCTFLISNPALAEQAPSLLNKNANCEWQPTFPLEAPDGIVRAMEVWNGELYVAGDFQNVGATAAAYVAKWNGTSWEALGTGLSGPGLALEVWDDNEGGGEALYVGGDFTMAGGGSANNIAKWTGSSWEALGTGTDLAVNAIVGLDSGNPAGILYIGGLFGEAGGDTNADFVAQWDGTAWSAMDNGGSVNGPVRALADFFGALFVGGEFTMAGGAAANHVAKWAGTWSPLTGSMGEGTDNFVNALFTWNSNLYVGGTFLNAGGMGASHVASWDGAEWSPLGSGVDDAVQGFAAFDDTLGEALFVSGSFDMAGGSAANFIAKWDTSAWSALEGPGGNGLGDTTLTMAGLGNSLYAGGAFFLSGGFASFFIAEYGCGGGATDMVDLSVTIDDGTVNVAPGASTTYTITVTNSGPDDEANATLTDTFPVELTCNTTSVAAGGATGNTAGPFAGDINETLNMPSGSSVTYTAVCDIDGGASDSIVNTVMVTGVEQDSDTDNNTATDANGVLSCEWLPTFDTPAAPAGGSLSNINDVVVWDDGNGAALYVTGNFSSILGVPANNIAKWDGTSWSALGTGLSGVGRTLEVYDDGGGADLIVGGDFAMAGGMVVNSVARWSQGGGWSALAGGVTGQVYDLQAWGDDLYAGGSISNAGAQSVNGVARWNGTGWNTGALLASGVNNFVRTLTLWNNELYVGGNFNTAGGVTANGIAMWNGAWNALMGSMDEGTDQTVLSSVVYDDGGGDALYIGGFFVVAGGKSASKIAKWTGTEWFALAGGVNDEVYDLAVFDDGFGSQVLIAAGELTTADGTTANGVAEWNGTSWSALDGPSGNGVDATALAATTWDNSGTTSLFVGGYFTRAGGLASDLIGEYACSIGAADIEVTVTDGLTEAPAGGATIYTITVTNNGPGTDPAVQLTDVFPGDLSCETTSSASGGALGNNPSFAGDINETLFMPSGSSVTYSALCNIDGSATGTLSNTATATPSITDTDLANNTATDDDTLLTFEVDLLVTVTDNVALASPGNNTTYIVEVANNGPATDPSATLTNTFPSDLDCAVTSEASAGASGNTPMFDGDINETLSLPANSWVTYTAVCAIDDMAMGTLSNTVNVTASLTDTDLANNMATDTTDLSPLVDFIVEELGLSTRSARVGQNVVLSYKVFNIGTFDHLMAAPDFSEKFYLSEDTNLDMSDVELGTTVTRPNELSAGGGVYEALELVTIPLMQDQGTYFLIVEADQEMLVAESDENNNLAFAQITVVPEDAVDWQGTGFLATGRRDHSATLLLTGEVLVAGGIGGDLTVGDAPIDRVEIYNPSTGLWRATASLAEPRASHTATLLPSGEVLVSGGQLAATTEIFNPRTEEWRTVPSPAIRRDTTMTLLQDGRVLVTGGRNGDVVLNSAQVFDHETETWSSVGNLNTGRWRHTASLLPSGKVLVVGGRSGGTLDSTEIFDPATDQWTLGPTLNESRAEHSTTVLYDGRVVTVGGASGSNIRETVEILDPEEMPAPANWTLDTPMDTPRSAHSATLVATGQVIVSGGRGEFGALLASEIYTPGSPTGTWTYTGALDTERYDHSATLLPSGKIMVTGGLFDTDFADAEVYLPDSEIYEPATIAWDVVQDLNADRVHHTASLLPDGDVLVVGGRVSPSDDEAELYDADTDSWGTIAPANQPQARRALHTATFLADGRLLVAGGHYNLADPSAEIFDPSDSSWTDTADMNALRTRHAAVQLLSGKVLVAGGLDASGFSYDTAEIYDGDVNSPDFNTWTPTTGNLHTTRDSARLTLLANGKVLLTGGYSDNRTLAAVEIYDPPTGLWTDIAPMTIPRSDHTATLLPSGRVLVTGGRSGGAFQEAEIFDPEIGVWDTTGSMRLKRYSHSATLLPSGRVLIVGGQGDESSLSSAEIFDPATGEWTDADFLDTPRFGHTATLLSSDEVLVAGGAGSPPTSQLFRRDPPSAEALAHQPTISSLELSTMQANVLEYGVEAVLKGNFRASTETSSGTLRNSSFAYPVVELRSLDGWRQVTLPPDADLADFWGAGDPTHTLRFNELPAGLRPGPYLLSVTTAGVRSTPTPISVVCSLSITSNPADAMVDLGEQATFTVEAQGALFFQWTKDGVDIPGANSATYVTPPVVPADVGSEFRVRLGSGCTTDTAPSLLGAEPAARLFVNDDVAPEVEVVSPNGGEVWTLPRTDPPEQSTVTISWNMSDNVRVCEAKISLWRRAPTATEFVKERDLVTLGGVDSDGLCANPGLATGQTDTSWEYDLPPDLPTSGFYKIQIEVLDAADNPTTAESANPFYIFPPNDNVLKTLFVWHPTRMKKILVAQGNNATEECPDDDSSEEELADCRILLLEQKLASFAEGFGTNVAKILDLGIVNDLDLLYDAWDQARTDNDPLRDIKDAANAILFGSPSSIHDYLRANWYDKFDLDYVVLVGDDRIIPMARILDRTSILNESEYPDGNVLTARDSTVAEALAGGYFLSDDALTRDEELVPVDMEDQFFLPEKAIGRLIQTPEEIRNTMTKFDESSGGLTVDENSTIFIAGYDFLSDSANIIAELWQRSSASPMLDVQIGPGLTNAQMKTSLCDQPSLVSLNGHATHNLIGTPQSAGTYSIGGLGMDEIDNDPTSDPPECALDGSVIYSVGCHSALPVAGASTELEEQDVAQTLLNAGAIAYVANTGYGWGVRSATGYSEHLVEYFTVALRRTDIGTVGEAVVEAKRRYRSFKSHLDAIDQKILRQWTLFGLPMYGVQEANAPVETEEHYLAGPPRAIEDLPRRESFGPVTVERWVQEGSTVLEGGRLLTPPPDLTRLVVSFDFQGEGVYEAIDAQGATVSEDAPQCQCTAWDLDDLDDCDQPTCTTPSIGNDEVRGCYFSLNNTVVDANLSAVKTDQPIVPQFIFDSRLSGTTYHGYLKTGSAYKTVPNWVPIIATPESNLDTGTEFCDDEGTIEAIVEEGGSGTPTDCRFFDPDFFGSLVVKTGENFQSGDDARAANAYNLTRITLVEEGEIFYFNSNDEEANCDFTGPILPEEIEITVNGGTSEETMESNYICSIDSTLIPDPPTLPPVIVVEPNRLCGKRGKTVRWEISGDHLIDAEHDGSAERNGVWRVVILWNDENADNPVTGTDPDSEIDNFWHSLELAWDEGLQKWVGEVTMTNDSFYYILQAVDFRGNVTKKVDEPGVSARNSSLQKTDGLPPSGIPRTNLQVDQVSFAVGNADLDVSISGPQGAIDGLTPVSYVVDVTNWGPTPANFAEVNLTTTGLTGVTATSPGWTCIVEDGGAWNCERDIVDLGNAPAIMIFGTTQGAAGTAILTATAETLSDDDVTANNSASHFNTVLATPEANLSVEQVASLAMDGWSPVFTITITNKGPDAVSGAEVLDVFPAGLTNIIWTCFADTPQNCNSGVGNLVDSINLLPGSSLQYVVETTLDGDYAALLTNTVEVEVPAGVLDPDMTSNNASVTLDYIAIFGDGFESGDLSAWSSFEGNE